MGGAYLQALLELHVFETPLQRLQNMGPIASQHRGGRRESSSSSSSSAAAADAFLPQVQEHLFESPRTLLWVGGWVGLVTVFFLLYRWVGGWVGEWVGGWVGGGGGGVSGWVGGWVGGGGGGGGWVDCADLPSSKQGVDLLLPTHPLLIRLAHQPPPGMGRGEDGGELGGKRTGESFQQLCGSVEIVEFAGF